MLLVKMHQKVTVFTTRADTLFGVTYLTLAPEHPLVSQITTQSQKEEVDAYVTATSSRSDLDRSSNKEKTGVFTGGYAIHPFTKEEIPVWIGDYVLYLFEVFAKTILKLTINAQVIQSRLLLILVGV